VLDIHTHIGRIRERWGYFTSTSLLRWMDGHGIGTACVMSYDSLDALYPVTSAEVLAATAGESRLIPFCCLDTRVVDRGLWRSLIEQWVEQGAKGFGEVMMDLGVDDPRLIEVYHICAEFKLPVLIHLAGNRGVDTVGLPGLRRVLAQCKETAFILHATHWWAEISQDITEDDLNSNKIDRPAIRPGALESVLGGYPNAYGDLSAMSGYGALRRLQDGGRAFLEAWSDRLLFGSDLVRDDQDVPQISHINSLGLPPRILERIMGGNARALVESYHD